MLSIILYRFLKDFSLICTIHLVPNNKAINPSSSIKCGKISLFPMDFLANQSVTKLIHIKFLSALSIAHCIFQANTTYSLSRFQFQSHNMSSNSPRPKITSIHPNPDPTKSCSKNKSRNLNRHHHIPTSLVYSL